MWCKMGPNNYLLSRVVHIYTDMLVYYMYNFDILIPLNSTYTSYTACAKKTHTLQLPIYFRPFIIG